MIATGGANEQHSGAAAKREGAGRESEKGMGW